jgi:hypothetical protein
MSIRSILLAAALAVSAAAATRAADNAAIQHQLQALHDRAVAAYQKKDVKGVMAYCAPDYISKGKDGKVRTREQMQALFKIQLGLLKSIEKISVRVGPVTTKGAEATDILTFDLAGMLADKQGKVHRLVSRSTTRETWARVGSSWQLKRSEVLTADQTIDGKKTSIRVQPPGQRKPDGLQLPGPRPPGR